jgi:hypothetical protein
VDGVLVSRVFRKTCQTLTAQKSLPVPTTNKFVTEASAIRPSFVNLRFLIAYFFLPSCLFVPTAMGQTKAPERTKPAVATAAVANRLEIGLPPGANVKTEVDAKEDDLLALIKQALASSSTATKGSQTSPTFDFGGMNLDPEVLSKIVRNIHHIHFINYDQQATGDAVSFHEKTLYGMGLRRMIYDKGSHVLLMLGTNPAEMAGVYQSGTDVMVLRMSGKIDFEIVGKLIHSLVSPPKPSTKKSNE